MIFLIELVRFFKELIFVHSNYLRIIEVRKVSEDIVTENFMARNHVIKNYLNVLYTFTFHYIHL